jgi:iron complex transport system ATP-binding protein
MDPTNAVDCQGVTLTLGGVDVLRGVDCQVPRGAVTALLGGNGSGKSTLLRLVAGYHFPTAGRIAVLGERFGACDLSELRRRIGVVDPGGAWTFDDRTTVRQAVATGFFGKLIPWFDEPSSAQLAEADDALAQVGIVHAADRPFATLSTGERRRALLARAWLQRPELLLLDEPTAGLDLLAREMFLATLDGLVRTRPALTVVMATHVLDDLLPATSHILLMNGGRTTHQGEPDRVLTNEILQAAFGAPVRVQRIDGRWHWMVSADGWKKLRDG